MNDSLFTTFENYVFLLSLIGKNTKEIRLNGRGESTLHQQFIEMLDYTHLNYPNLKVSVHTNLAFSNQSIINKFIECNIRVITSIDSTDKEEFKYLRGGNFDLIDNNIKLLETAIERPYVIFTIQEYNLHRIYDIAQYCVSNKLNLTYGFAKSDEEFNESFKNKVIEQYQFIINEFQKAIELYKKTDLDLRIPNHIWGVEITNATHLTPCNIDVCAYAETQLFITYNLDVRPCNMMNDYVYGNLAENELQYILNKSESFKNMNYPKNNYCLFCANTGI